MEAWKLPAYLIHSLNNSDLPEIKHTNAWANPVMSFCPDLIVLAGF